jgi:hypothetical protein
MAVGFFAYPAVASLVLDAITGAVEISKGEDLKLTPWPKLRTIGFKIDDLIREKIREADVLVADISYPNHNVLYELGYAIAAGKPVIPTIDVAIEKAVERVQTLGLFDNIGWATYNNAEELSQKLRGWNDVSWKSRYSRRRNHTQPLFVLDTQAKTDFRNQIFHAVENSPVNFRTFDPAEVPRLTAATAIAEISSSAGVIVPIISDAVVDSLRNNLRAAFLLGLAHGYEVEPLAIQYENGPAPLDYRDFITNSTFRHETERHVTEYCAQTLVWNQRLLARDKRPPAGILERIDLGSSTAENEIQQLGYYFVRTAEFARATRAEGAVVVGRKGSGKSAVFLQLVEVAGRDRRKCIVDLRPASHNLTEMRDALLSVVSAGVFDHTVAAFWQYIAYMEILLKIRELMLPRSRNDSRLQDRIREIEETFSLSESMVAGDFTSRLESAVRLVVRFARQAKDAEELRAQLTNAMFEEPIPKLRDAIVSFQDQFSEILFLLDDLDKGWPALRVENHDVTTVRHFVEVLSRVQRDLSRRGVGFRHLVFLRSDVFDILVAQTSDRGKYNPIRVDWSDPEQLRHVLRQRVISSLDSSEHESAWAALNPQLSTMDAVDRMIECSLRRPRFLIDLCEKVLSSAINRGHSQVDSADVDEGMRLMSLYLVSDFAYEMRDVAGTPEDIFYRFIGASDLLTESELETILSPDALGLGLKATTDLLLWYGFLGVVPETNNPVFIYDRAYDFRRLEAERPKGQEALYAINPAFLRGLRRA